jgi:hypothetical protein
LRTAFVESDAVFQIGSVPGRAVAGGGAIPQKAQHFTLKIRFADGMLRDQPCCLRSVFSGDVLSGPAVLCHHLAEARGIPGVDSLHAGNVGSAELAALEKFLAHAEIFGLHFEQFAPEILVDHGFILRGARAVARLAVGQRCGERGAQLFHVAEFHGGDTRQAAETAIFGADDGDSSSNGA